MSRGWRALEKVDAGGWVCRFSGGVAKRANSVLPLQSPADPGAAIAAVEEFYAARGLPAVFQISPDSRPADLDSLLAERGYLLDSPTLVQYLSLVDAGNGRGVGQDPRIECAEDPSDAWLETLWSIEGPHDPEAQTLSRLILDQTPSVYASLVLNGRVEAVARLALVGNLGGIYAVATRADSRSRGHGRAIVQELLTQGAKRNLEGLWLQVVESNSIARGLYESLGFETVSRYHYRVEPALRS